MARTIRGYDICGRIEMAEGRSADLYSPSDWESRSEQRWKEGGIPDYQVRYGMIRIEPGRKAKVSILLSRKRRDWRRVWRQASGEKIYNGKRADKENGHLFVYSSNLELTGMLRKEKKESSWKRIKGNVKGLADNHRACPNIVNWQKLGKFDWISAW